MARFFSRFPGGWPGLGLLLLRATVGIAAGAEGGACFLNSENAIFGAWLVGGLAVAAGTLLLIGFLTTVASLMAGSACIALVWFPSPINPLDAKLAAFMVIMSGVIVLVGPGAFSLDSRLFGRREITIPPVSD